ncbi:MAG: Na+-transporting NADH:ubiquinone oxidoreductase subunit [Clostridiales bacterium]|nr:Na+-transporting NADH:ubiquinone oxidoreductase subunit [Clostridiales bacterium]
MKYFMKQALMRKVIFALIPLQVLGILFFGWRTFFLLIINTVIAAIIEWGFVRKTTGKISEAVVVTAMLFTLTLPPSLPYWISGIGIAFGVLFGKMVFGGFGKNPFNPALVGRAFIYVNFPSFMTGQWQLPQGLNGALAYSVDTVSQATPMSLFRQTGEMTALPQMLIGNISGSIGETSAAAIIVIAIVLLVKKVIAKDTFWSVIISFIVFDTAFYLLGSTAVPNPLYGLLSGGILFGATFMATDPISSPKTVWGKRLYGIIIGGVTVIIRGYALFSGGVMFAILIGNTFAPILDELVTALKKSKTPVKAGKEASHG